MRRPTVTIGIPTRNRAALLERALRSALAQQDVALEVVVQPRDATLTEAEIEALSAQIVAAAAKTGAALRT